MRYKIQLLSQAKDDVREARNYYNTVVPQLGKRFINDFRMVLEKIENNPFIYGSRIEEFRTANLKTFPYQLQYIIEEANEKL